MHLNRMLTTGALCVALGLSAGTVAAQSSMEDATIKADEAAEAEAKAAEAIAEEQADKMKEAAEMEKEAVRGEPMEEAEVYGEE